MGRGKKEDWPLHSPRGEEEEERNGGGGQTIIR